MKVFLFAVAAVSVLVCSLSGYAADKKVLERGKIVFKENCASCHGETGAGDGVAAAALNPKPRNLVTEKFKAGSKPAEIFKSVTDGLPGTLMVSFKHLPEADRKAVSEFVASLVKKGKSK